MANQITIDIGAAANDGTGDPLRTAFNYVNNNFSNVWNTGLPNSNVQFSDNRILTVNTNANLVLAPNGVGKVASNVDIVPNTANVFALGSSTRRWNTVYGQYLDLSHNAVIGGNLVVTGNLSAGNISYTSNVFVGDLEGSVFDGASSIVLDVIDSTIYVDNYRYANGAPVVFGGNYGNANVAAFLSVFGSNSISTTGNISAGNASVTNVVASQSIYSTVGTFTGDQFSDGAMYIGSPAGTVLGSDVVIQITANSGSYSQTNFQNINSGVTASSDYILTADNGNDSTHFLDIGITSSGWDGSEPNVLSGLVPNNGYLYVQDGNLSLGVRNVNTSYRWNFDTAGNLTVPNGGYINFVNTGGITQTLNEDLRFTVSDDEQDGWAIQSTVNDGAGNDLTRMQVRYDGIRINTDLPTNNYSWDFRDSGEFDVPGPIRGPVGGNLVISIGDQFGAGPTFIDLQTRSYVGDALISNIRIGDPNVTISTASGAQNWTFGSTGTLTLPSLANISGGNFNAGTASATVALNAFSPDGNTVSMQAQGNTSSAVISIFSNTGPVTSNWTFTTAPLDPTESFLYVPPGGSISTPDATGGEGGKNIFIQAGASDPVTWNSNPGGELYIKGGYGSFGDGGGGPGGNVNINGGESSDSHAGNVNITAGAFRYWSFDYTGNLNLPPSGNIVGVTANNNGYLNWFGNSSGDGAGYTTMRLVPDDTRESADQYLIIDPTAPGHIHIRAGGTQDNSGADLFLGGENSYFKVASGANSQVQVTSNSNTWVFNTDGNLQVPGNINGDNSAPLIIDGASAGVGYISLPHSTFGGEKINIVNQFSLGNGISLTTNGGEWHFGNNGSFTAPGPMSLVVYANTTVRDSSITSPTPGMMIYVTGTGMQVRGATSWNTIAGSGT